MRQQVKRKVGSLCLIGWIFAIVGCSNTRRPEKYLIPNGYVGWICVEYEVKKAPPLPVVNGYYVLNIPATGYLKTSSKIEGGRAKDEFYYATPTGQQRIKSWGGWGEGNMVWPGTLSGGKTIKQGKRTTFVGHLTKSVSANREVG